MKTRGAGKDGKEGKERRGGGRKEQEAVNWEGHTHRIKLNHTKLLQSCAKILENAIFPIKNQGFWSIIVGMIVLSF